MRDPYRRKPDLSRLGLIAIGLLALIGAVLITIYLLQPSMTAEDRRRSETLERQMDRAQAASDVRETTERAREARAMQ